MPVGAAATDRGAERDIGRADVSRAIRLRIPSLTNDLDTSCRLRNLSC